jgi:hypothetical protein
MRLSGLEMRSSWENSAITAILTQLSNAMDLSGNRKLIYSAEETLTKAMEDVVASFQPPEELCPAVRTMGGHIDYPIDSVMFLRTDGFLTLPLYFIYKSEESNFERLRRDHINMCLRALEQTTADNTVGIDREAAVDWCFKIEPWNCVIDHDTPLKHLRYITLIPPHYCSRVDLQIQVNNIHYNG